MKTYELHLHGKQGDDFSAHIQQSDNTYAGLNAWAESMRDNAETCEKIAEAIGSAKIAVCSDTHMISFTPKTKAAEKILKLLAKRGLLTEMDY